MRIRVVLFLALIGFLATVQPFGSQTADLNSNEPVIKIDQAQWPPPPDCGIYPDTCQSDEKV